MIDKKTAIYLRNGNNDERTEDITEEVNLYYKRIQNPAVEVEFGV